MSEMIQLKEAHGPPSVGFFSALQYYRQVVGTTVSQ